MNILISSALGPNGIALSAWLKKGVNKLTLIDGNGVGDVLRAPMISDFYKYRDYFHALIKNRGIDRYIPCSDHDLKFLLSIEPTDLVFKLGVPEKNTIEIFTDKQKSIAVARKYFNVPVFESREEDDFFVRNKCAFVRPKFFKKISYDQIDQFSTDEFIVTNYVSGPEYTVDVYYCPDESPLISIRQRIGVENGISQFAKFIIDDNLHKSISDFVVGEKIYGFSCTQFIKSCDEYFFIETNTRPAGGIKHSLAEYNWSI